MDIRVKDLINLLGNFNPDAVVNVDTGRCKAGITGIYGWSSDSDSCGDRDITMEKLNTTAVTLETTLSSSETTNFV